MILASDLIHAAFRIAGVIIASGRIESDSQQTEGLYKLNSLLDTWRLPTLDWYEIQTNVHTLIPGHNPHTIGVGGDLNQERPVKIVEAYLRYVQSNPPVDTIIRELTVEQYAQIPAKSIQSPIPQWFYYDAAYSSATDPKGNLYLYLVPSQANQIVLCTPKILTQPATLGTVMLLPPGYQRALEYNLAVELVPLFPKRQNDARADAAMYQNAKESLYAVKVNNAKPLDIKSDPAAQSGLGGMWDWRTGSWRY